ncbi:peptide deformylase [Parenemella sanctibonifatiensis]|uniref:Peptide deformylase n=1 Tax=Parenemella sanctibonifatiensis TaxID=2016505 RepID=A0A255EED0_9ACTN|nr:peptide deformylase [Parenemella sanctibonifatiensis]OYN89906.1 peptide deformylase [Parenemella sanctibonifatiensis]
MTEDLTAGGTVLPITRWGEPVMHAKTEPVTTFDDELHALVRDMFATMEAADGVGLAGTQVGRSLAVFVFDCPDADDVRTVGVVCNPVVELPEGKDRKLEAAEEGCLSLPGAFQSLARPDRAICRGQDAHGNDIEIVGTGLLARCLQHETDHLNGTVFGDRLSARSRKQLYATHNNAAARYPEDWPVSPKLLVKPTPADDE